MRILHFLSGLEVGGKERQVLQLSELARRAGHSVELLLFDTPFRSSAVDFDPGDLPVHFVRRGSGLDWGFAREVARLVRRLAPAVLHAHNDTAVFYAGVVATLLGRAAPAVCGTFHNQPGHDTPMARFATRLASRRADAVTAVSGELAELCLRDRWVRHCDVIWNGVDLEQFTPRGPDGDWRARLDVDRDACLVGHMGRFAAVKRQADLLAATRLAARTAPVVTVFVGQGPDRGAFVSELRAGDPVRTLERIEDVPPFLRALDVLVLCSGHEAAPRVLLEAMASGLAVVATAVGGVPRIVSEPQRDPAALLVPPAEPEALAQALVGLAHSSEKRGALGRRARERALDFSAQREWERYAELYARICT